MCHTYTICSLAEERSRPDIDGLRVRASPEALRCVLEHDTLYSAQYWFSPGEVGGILFWRRPSVHPSVCLSVCPPVIPDIYLSTYWFSV